MLGFGLTRKGVKGLVGSLWGASPQITAYLFDERFGVDRGPELGTDVVTFEADTLGQWKQREFTDTVEQSGGLYYPSNSCATVDNRAATQNTAGRVHYLRAYMSDLDHQSWRWGLTDETSNPDSNNRYHTGGYRIGFEIKGTAPGNWVLRYVREGSTSGTFLAEAGDEYGLNVDQYVDMWIVERETQGAFLLYSIDGGPVELIYISDWATIDGKLGTITNGADDAKYDRMASADSDWLIAPFFAESFERADTSIIPASNGDGQPETATGAALTPTVTGDVEIASNWLQMASDGSATVIYDGGETDVFLHCHGQVYDGSPLRLMVRYQDANNYYAVEYNSTNDTVYIIQRIAGVETVVSSGQASGLLTADNGATLNDAEEIGMLIRARGDEIRVWYDHNPTAVHEMSPIVRGVTNFLTATKFGVLVSKGSGVNSSRAKNLAAWVVEWTPPAI